MTFAAETNGTRLQLRHGGQCTCIYGSVDGDGGQQSTCSCGGQWTDRRTDGHIQTQSTTIPSPLAKRQK